MRRSTFLAASVAVIAGLAASPGVAQAATFICVPATAGAAVTSGGASGSCSAGTAVELPASSADQQTLLSMLPHMSFSASGIGGKPTITVTGANLQVRKAAATAETATDGTGNLIVGRASNPYSRSRTGSDNLAVGDAHGWAGEGALLAGFDNQARGFHNVIFGQDGLVSGDRASVLGGYGNTASGLRSSVGGGASKTATDTHQVIADGVGAPAAKVHWVRLGPDGYPVAKSGSDAYGGSWGIGRYYVGFHGVDLTKCSISTAPIRDYTATPVQASVYATYASYTMVEVEGIKSGTSPSQYENVSSDVYVTATCS